MNHSAKNATRDLYHKISNSVNYLKFWWFFPRLAGWFAWRPRQFLYILPSQADWVL